MLPEDREIQLQEQINKGQQAREALGAIRPWLEAQRQEIYKQMEDKANHDETRLKYHLIAIREIERGLEADIMTGQMAIKEFNS